MEWIINNDIFLGMPKNLKAEIPFVVTLRKDAKQEHGCQKNNGNCSHVCLFSSITSFVSMQIPCIYKRYNRANYSINASISFIIKTVASIYLIYNTILFINEI